METIHGVLVVAVGLALAAGAVHAQLPLRADDIDRLAREGNPDLRAARLVIAEAAGRARTTGRLANPELEVEVAGGQEFEGRVSLGLVQRFPLTARLRFERELSALAVERARLEVRVQERQLGVAARQAFYEVAAARAAGALAKAQTEAAATFAQSLARGASEGFGSALDARQASLAADRLRATEESLRAEELRTAARLSDLLGLPADREFSIRESLVLPKTPPAARPIGRRPEVELAELSRRAGATDVSLAKASRWDDVGVGVFVEGERFRDEPEGIEPEALVGVRFSVPLPFWQDGSGNVAEKQAALERHARQMEARRLAVRNEALTAQRVMTARFRAAMQMQAKLVPAARQQVAAAEAAYQRAETDIQSVFRAREALAEVESAALDARKNYFLSFAEWLGAVGHLSNNP